MDVIKAGFVYRVDNKHRGGQIIKFIDNKAGIDGTITQELLRVAIDRTKVLEAEKHHPYNKEIIFHIRKALSLYEQRHLDVLVDRDLPIEDIPTVDGSAHLVRTPEEIKK